jgi:hypothetical protein
MQDIFANAPNRFLAAAAAAPVYKHKCEIFLFLCKIAILCR